MWTFLPSRWVASPDPLILISGVGIVGWACATALDAYMDAHMNVHRAIELTVVNAYMGVLLKALGAGC
jgi:hypothetical protein